MVEVCNFAYIIITIIVNFIFALLTDDVFGGVHLGFVQSSGGGGAMPIFIDVCVCGPERKEERS